MSSAHRRWGDSAPGMLLAVSRGSRAAFGMALVFMMLGMTSSFMLPQAVRFAVDSVIGGAVPESAAANAMLGAIDGLDQRSRLAACAAFVVALACVGGACDYISRRAVAVGAEGAACRLRDRLAAHILALPYSWHMAVKTGDIVQRCTSDVDTVRSFFLTQLPEAARALALVAFAYSILFGMNVTAAAVSFAFLPVISIYSIAFLRRAAVRYLDADAAEGELLSIAQENFTGVRVVRAFGQERAEADKFAAQNERFAQLWIKLGSMLSTYWGVGDVITGAQMASLCVVCAVLASRGELTVGEFIVFTSYSAMTIWPVRGLGRVLSEAGKAAASIGRIMEVLRAEEERDEPGAITEPAEGGIEFRGVSFSYGGDDVLRDVSFAVPKGGVLGVLGATGSGKTTIARLLCRMYDADPGRGEILLGGVPIRSFARRSLRASIGYVQQEPFLFSRTIEENIASLRGASRDDVVRAAQDAQVHDAIEAFADGYGTVVGERGVTLSGGQRQRVAIARALLPRPSILIFDDSLSAVDTETDARIREALASRTEGATVVIIAHRIASVARADVVVVLEGGRVAEAGSPGELYAAGGAYRRMCDMQEARGGGDLDVG